MTSYSIGVSVHTASDTDITVEFVKAHDSVRDDYYRMKLGGDCTVFMSRETVVRLQIALQDEVQS